ncbi:MAG: hypothetical protein AB7U75_14680 [Hyphomicrobiaceae bacterium]
MKIAAVVVTYRIDVEGWMDEGDVAEYFWESPSRADDAEIIAIDVLSPMGYLDAIAPGNEVTETGEGCVIRCEGYSPGAGPYFKDALRDFEESNSP